jgi:hypothetical protein
MEFKYTKHQVARGVLPDAETSDKIILLKRCSELRATYQIKLLAYLAYQKQKKLVIELPKNAKIHNSLKELSKQHLKLIKIERS